MVATDRHLVLAGGSPGDTNGQRVGFTAGTGKAHHVCPGVQLDQPFCQPDFLGAVERRHIAVIDGAAHRIVDLRVTVAKNIGAHSHDAHVGVGLAVHIPDGAPLGLAEIRRPLLRKEHLCALGQQHIAAGNDLFGPFPQLLTGAHSGPLVTYQRLVVFEQRRAVLLQCLDLPPAEVNVRRKVRKHAANHL